MNTTVILDIQLQAFSQNEIISRIPENVFNEIKAKDKHPFFQLYSVCHEGTSKPKVLGKGYKPITWLRESIQSIKNVVKKGINFFAGHNTTNENQDKKILGEVIHAFEEMIDNKLHFCTIGYFPPETREEAKKLDICSQEAEWNLIESGGQLIADTCSKITGIALGNSQYQQPAFEDAKRLVYVQAFEDKEKPGQGTDSGQDDVKGVVMDLTGIPFNDLMGELNRRNIVPSQAFTPEQILKDKVFGTLFKETKDFKAIEEKLNAKNKEYEELTKTRDQLDRTIKLNTAKDKLTTLYKELGYTDNMQKFVNKMYDTNKDNIQDLTDEGLKTFAENQKAIFQMANGEEDKKSDINIPTGDNQPDPENETDFSKAENNSLLKEDYNPDEL